MLRQIKGDEQVVLSLPITLIPSSKHFSIVLSINFDWLLKISIAQVFRIISFKNIYISLWVARTYIRVDVNADKDRSAVIEVDFVGFDCSSRRPTLNVYSVGLAADNLVL